MNEYVKASRILRKVLSESRHLDECFDDDTSPLTQQICYGVCREYFYLEAVLKALLDKPLPEKHLDLKALLLAGLYSVDHLNRPAHASVNAAVSAASGLKKSWAKGLVNGIIRRYLREKESLSARMSNESDEVKFNHPAWLVSSLQQAWPDQWKQVLAANMQQAPMTLRVNLRQLPREEYLQNLRAAGLDARAGDLCDMSVILNSPVAVSLLPGFADGQVSVQDEAAQLAPELMNLKGGMDVLDACAAPGGKTCHILESANVSLTAIDRDRKRIHRIQDNLQRLSMQADVQAIALEALEATCQFDRILLDAPCSATGIIRRHPDIKLLRQKSDVDKLTSTQRALLMKAFELLKPGGELVYATCSVLPSENEEIVNAFVEGNSNAISLAIEVQSSSSNLIPTPRGLQLLPTMQNHDGFYYARIGKTS